MEATFLGLNAPIPLLGIQVRVRKQKIALSLDMNTVHNSHRN